MREDIGIAWKEGEETRSFLVGVYAGIPNMVLCEEHLSELERLADTFGVETVAKMACPLRKIDAATYLHKGKLEEIAERMAATGANLVIFDEEISPAQQRNLEKLLAVPVMDRTELILEIFAQRAHSKEARLQVELAKTKYEFPRLKRMWSHFSRQRASGGYLRGAGETQLEIDKRLLKKKLEKLSDDLKEVEKYRETQKTLRHRTGIPTVAIIGYTNAGKSTLLNALTQAHVLVEDKLFATLDPTTRKFMLPNNEEILLTDTVGFIRKLPHTLVAAFKSTLEAAVHDDILLHVIDASHPLAEEQAETTLALLKDLNADLTSIIHVLNKVDASTPSTIQKLRFKYSKTVPISALNKTGFEDLSDAIIRALKERRQELHLRIPQSNYALVATLRTEGEILSLTYDGNDILIHANIPHSRLPIYTPYLVKEE